MYSTIHTKSCIEVEVSHIVCYFGIDAIHQCAHRMELRIPCPRVCCSNYESLACSKSFDGRRCQAPSSRMISVDLCRRSEKFASLWAVGGVTTYSKHLGDKVGKSGNRREELKWRGKLFRAAMNSAEERSSSSPGAVHFVGVGGAGLSALALLALKQGWRVSGSDLAWNDQMEGLKEAGARVYVGHNAVQMAPAGLLVPDALVVSSAVGPGNVEVDAARALQVPIYKRDAWLGKLTEDYELIAVAGTHGKSTVTAMLSVALCSLGEDITAIVGAQVPQFPNGGNAMFGTSSRFILEADEYDGCFLGVSPSLAVVTSVEWEHVDMYPDEAAVRDNFKKFSMRIRLGGMLVVCSDCAGAKSLVESLKVENWRNSSTSSQNDTRHFVTYGLGASADWRAIMLVPNPWGGTDYTVVYNNRPMVRVSLRLPGMHNVLNSLAVIVVNALLAAKKESLEVNSAEHLRLMKGAAEAAGAALGNFVGLRRRFERIGTIQGCDIVDDYAHHPTEIRAVLQAARQCFDQQPIWVVFQPHTVSRLAKLLPDFAPAFSAADRVIVTEVYTARNIQNDKMVTGADLANAIIGPPATYIPDLDGVVERLSWELAAIDRNAMNNRGNVVLLTLGAGDITSLGPKLIQALSVPSI